MVNYLGLQHSAVILGCESQSQNTNIPMVLAAKMPAESSSAEFPRNKRFFCHTEKAHRANGFAISVLLEGFLVLQPGTPPSRLARCNLLGQELQSPFPLQCTCIIVYLLVPGRVLGQ